MITCKNLGHGRLGNNLFAIAATIGTARKFNTDYVLPAEWKYYDNFVGQFRKYTGANDTPPYNEPHFHYKEIPNLGDMDLVGYYQSEKYFEHCKEEIRDMFTFKPEVLSEVQSFMFKELCKNPLTTSPQNRRGTTVSISRTACSIHIRRGDYVQGMAHYYHELTLDWYVQVMNQFPDNHFFICSDDIQWVREHFPKAPNITFSSFDEIRDLCLMSQCQNNIMANSSFSFWGQMLNRHPDKKVIAPTKDKWFKPVAGHNMDSLYENQNWILL